MGESDVIRQPVCLNCDAQIDFYGEPKGDLFCSLACKQTAKLVRYARKKHGAGRSDDPAIAWAIKIKIATVLGGGYDERGRRLSPEEREFVFNRAHGRCNLCGDDATEIDHLGVEGIAVNDPANLQAICRSCHTLKTMSSLRPIETEEKQAMFDDILDRIHAPIPLRMCDASDWSERWASLRRLRRDASWDWE